ncbi:hypothetical protein THOM_1530 [Trachipleistophora hominis]|uniref:Uncharacterized protein n=1 Tax=Trachipleistophora hominis TaxID=72359 RepID=L7JWQ0_TRAHO|nr:hypothetical protein THOM_1530 [Trachipleistophora hominis]
MNHLLDILFTLTIIIINTVLYYRHTIKKRAIIQKMSSTTPSSLAFSSINQHILSYESESLALILNFKKEFDIFHYCTSFTDSYFIFTGYVDIEWLNCYLGVRNKNSVHALKYLEKCKSETGYYGTYNKDVLMFYKKHRLDRFYITFIPRSINDTNFDGIIYAEGKIGNVCSGFVDDIIALIACLRKVEPSDRLKENNNMIKKRILYEASKQKDESNKKNVEDKDVKRRERENTGYEKKKDEYKLKTRYLHKK